MNFSSKVCFFGYKKSKTFECKSITRRVADKTVYKTGVAAAALWLPLQLTVLPSAAISASAPEKSGDPKQICRDR